MAIGKRIFFYLVCIFPFTSLPAQNGSAIVEGSVYDKSTGKAIEFANAQLIRLPDSTLGSITVTDKRGKFRLENIAPGLYTLRCSFVGYEVLLTPSFTITQNSPVQQVGKLELLVSGKDLNEVVVTSRKQSLVTGIDRKVYNVDQDIMSRSGSASEILRNIPSVEVDVEGQVMLRGSGDVMILVNGKPSPMMGRSRAEILQQLPAHSIERIEVITNPSARYRPDGVSGIINIVLRKNVKNGFNGTLVASAGSRDRYNAGVNLNYRPGKFNLFGNYNIRQDLRRRFNDMDRVYFDSLTGMEEAFVKVHSRSNAPPFGHRAGIGLDYTIDDRNTMGLSGNIFIRRQKRNDFQVNQRFDPLHSLTEHFDRVRNTREKDNERDGRIYFTHEFKGEDHQLDIEFNTERAKEIEDNRFQNIFYLPASKLMFDNTVITAIDEENQLTVDYTTPLGESMKLEAGYDGSYVSEDLDFYGEIYDTIQSRFIKDPKRSNRFIYRENIHAIYTTIEKTWERWGMNLGVRAEQAFTSSRLVTLDSLVKNNYFKLYPTVHISFAIREGHELQLNYSKRVNRPDADELNPFPEYQEPRHLRSGNPKLLPEIIHSVEFGYKWQRPKFSLVPSIYYRYKVNGYISVTEPLDDTVMVTRMQNLSNDQSAGLELILSVKTPKWFSANLSSNFFYNRVEGPTEAGIRNRSLVSMSANFNTQFTLSKTSFLQLSANYRSARLTTQGKTIPTTLLNMGFRQDLFNSKLSLSLTASDIFSTQRQKTILKTRNIHQVSINRRDGRVIFFGLSYRFGIIRKEKEEKMQFDDNL